MLDVYDLQYIGTVQEREGERREGTREEMRKRSRVGRFQRVREGWVRMKKRGEKKGRERGRERERERVGQ